MTSLASPFLLTSFCLCHLLTGSASCLLHCSVKHTLTFFCPFFRVPSDLLWFVREYISFGQANFEGYTTEVIFQSFKNQLMTINCRVSTPNGGFGECILLICSKFCVLVYRVYGIFDAELCTTSWAPVLTNS